MALFAKISEDNSILEVLSVNDEVLTDENGTMSEQKGIDFLTSIYGHTNWKQTFLDGSLRKNFAFVGSEYSPELDAFIPFKPWESWVLDTNTVKWIAPLPYPLDGREYVWDEANNNWKFPDTVI